MLGTKIENLKILREKNINVPEFFVIKYSDVFKDYTVFNDIINENEDLQVDKLSELLKRAVDENINITLELDFPFALYSVRSSASIEDGSISSFAGQFDTYLNVKKEELSEKIKLCFKSLYNKNVLEYMRIKKLNFSDLKMNVIVQKMIIPDYSGVIFTANPQGILNEAVIVSGVGVGENVVQDKVKTTTYYYNLTDKLYYYEGDNDYLCKNIIENIIDESKKIEDILGKYLDIEFAIENDNIYILQARKITTLSDNNPLILDNSNIVESYPGISLPLTCSFVNIIYSGIFKALSQRILKNNKVIEKYESVFSNMVGNVNGRMYYKMSNWYTVIKFLPFSSKIVPIWQEMLGVKNKTYSKEKIEIPILTRMMTYYNAIYELVKVEKNMNKLNEQFLSINDYFYNTFSKNLSEKEIVNLYYEIKDKILNIWDITLINDMYSFIYTALLKNKLKKRYKDYEEITNEYISGISNIESLKPIKAMITLAYNKDKISKEEFEKEVENYIKLYGDRNLEELKLESKTFRTDKQILLEKIDEYTNSQNLQQLYENINTQNVKKLPKNRYARKCMIGINNREISRLNRCRIFGMVREIFLTLGEKFVKRGIIEEKRDIFYLTVNEVFSIVDNDINISANAKSLVNTRKQEYKTYKLLPSYSRLIFQKNEFNKSHVLINSNKVYQTRDVLKGIPCSNGIVQAEALVIEDINNISDVKGKILVTRMTDPGWVFLLATAKGIISEKGSLLSHTAIVSRELKIPSIVGVENVLNIIKTGDIVKMDANTGIIEIQRS